MSIALLTELVDERAEWIVNDISGGATARYVRIYASTFYRFEDVTERVMALLELPLVRAHGMHTAAIYGSDADLVARIQAAVGEKAAAVPPPPARPEPPAPSGGKRVRPVVAPKPRSPRGSMAK
jgi:hypothetical protein